ncbi:MAG: nuclear transport factor 2 family protein [Rhodanobacteraceae bacterium]
MTVRKHSFSLCLGLLLPGIIALGAPVAAAAAGTHVDEAAKTAAAVTAVDDHWLRAEVSGNTTWLDSMLMPEYRTVSSNGKIGTKAMLLKSAAKNRGSDKMRKQVEAWQKTHKTKTSVVMQGNTALLTFSDPKTGHIRSSDLFVYKDGGWHALYSQHAKTE